MAAVRTSAPAWQADCLAYRCDASQVTREPISGRASEYQAYQFLALGHDGPRAISAHEDVDRASRPPTAIVDAPESPPAVLAVPVVPEDLSPAVVHHVTVTVRASQPVNPVVRAVVADQSSCSDQSMAYVEEEEVHHLRQVDHLHSYPCPRASARKIPAGHLMDGMAYRRPRSVVLP